MTRKPKASSAAPRLGTPAAAITEGGLLYEHGFSGPTWDRWRACLKAAYGEPLTEAEDVLFREVAGRNPPSAPVRELWCVCGRRAGKDSIASAIAVIAALGDYSKQLRPGEKATIMCLAMDRSQANIIFSYISAYFEQIPALKPLVLRATDETLDLANNCQILVSTNSFRAVRGRSVVCCILDEVAYYRSDESANPDGELYNALEPALSTFENSMLIGISSPYRRQGLLFDKWKASYGKDDPATLVIRGASRLFNTKTLKQETVDRRLAVDPEAGAAEYLAEWRSDLSDFLDRELVEGAVDEGVVARPPRPDCEYKMFIDPSGGRGDAFTAAIAHSEGDLVLIDAIYERKSPFNPSPVAEEISNLAREYRVSRAIGDHHAAGWVTEAFNKVGILYEHSKPNRSDIYLNTLPLFTSGRLRILDNQRLIHQFVSLERRTGRSGKDSVQHPDGSHDDMANAAAGAAVLAASDARPALIRQPDLLIGGQPYQHTCATQYFATLWVSGDGLGRTGWVIWAHSEHDQAVPLVIEDFDAVPYRNDIVGIVVSRMRELYEELCARRPGAMNRTHIFLTVPSQLVAAGTGCLCALFGDIVRMNEERALWDRPPLCVINVEAVDRRLLEDGAGLLLDVAQRVGLGLVKLSPQAALKSASKPLLGVLALKAGEDPLGDPLRVALMLCVRELGPPPDGRPSGAPMRW